jgi:hypothetical protein
MSENFTFKHMEKRDFGNKYRHVKRMYKKNGEGITPEETRELYLRLQRGGEQKYNSSIFKISFNAWTGTKANYFSTYEQILDEDEYMDGKVRDTTKFECFNYIDIITYTPKNMFL